MNRFNITKFKNNNIETKEAYLYVSQLSHSFPDKEKSKIYFNIIEDDLIIVCDDLSSKQLDILLDIFDNIKTTSSFIFESKTITFHTIKDNKEVDVYAVLKEQSDFCCLLDLL